MHHLCRYIDIALHSVGWVQFQGFFCWVRFNVLLVKANETRRIMETQAKLHCMAIRKCGTRRRMIAVLCYVGVFAFSVSKQIERFACLWWNNDKAHTTVRTVSIIIAGRGNSRLKGVSIFRWYRWDKFILAIIIFVRFIESYDGRCPPPLLESLLVFMSQPSRRPSDGCRLPINKRSAECCLVGSFLPQRWGQGIQVGQAFIRNRCWDFLWEFVDSKWMIPPSRSHQLWYFLLM